MDSRYLVGDYNKDVMFNNTFLVFMVDFLPTIFVLLMGLKYMVVLQLFAVPYIFLNRKKGYLFKLHPEHSVIFSELYAVEKV